MSVRDLQEGTIVDDRYRVKHRIGSGGMADVYCATDEQLGRDVALKLLHRRFAEDHEFVERFRREASSAAGLQHPNIVGIFDRGEWDGTSYIAMEHLEGRTLKQVITEEAPLEPVRAIDLAIQLLRAARFAHKRGIVHRDLKPHNAIVDYEDRAKVTDFGIARAGASDMTETGSIMGTAQYLSPEQAQGLAVDERSDLYSVGIVLYEMLTGQVPFEGESAVSIALKQVSEAPAPPSRLNPAVPAELEGIVLRALEKDPARRFQDADQFVTALDRARGHLAEAATQPVAATTAFAPVAATALAAAPPAVGEAYAAGLATAPPPPPPPPPDEHGRRWWPWALLLVLLALAGGAAAGYFLSRPRTVAVPSVVGQPAASARAALVRRRFHVQEQLRNAARVARGNVIAQDPAGGTQAERGSTVTLTVSAGPATRAVPDVTGKGRRAAERILRGAGFQVVEQRQPSDTVAPNNVISTSPAAGDQADVGSPVTVTLSSGKPQVAVPSVVGETQDAATSQLQGQGFQVTVTQKASDQQPGTVLSQTPDAGQKAPQGSTVAIVVAKKAQVGVPGLVGEQEGTAVNDLSTAGLSPRINRKDVGSPNQDGVVLSQSPKAGTKVDKGSTVTITVGRFNPNLNPEGTNTTPTTPQSTTTTPGGG